MIIVAKFSSVCPCCSARIDVGSKVEWSKGAKAKHVACAVTGRSSTVTARGKHRIGGARRYSCPTGGNCSSVGAGYSCGAHDCDGH